MHTILGHDGVIGLRTLRHWPADWNADFCSWNVKHGSFIEQRLKTGDFLLFEHRFFLLLISLLAFLFFEFFELVEVCKQLTVFLFGVFDGFLE